jgi:uncharacterized membrane protein YedE/YeeE
VLGLLRHIKGIAVIIDSVALEAWLTKSVAGIFLLGVIGSIVATIVIYLCKRIFVKAAESKEYLALRLMYPYGREVMIGEEVRDKLGPQTHDAQFLVYHTFLILACVADVVLFACSATLTAHVVIAYGITRPYLLGSMFALNIIFFSAMTKSGVRVSSHQFAPLEAAVKKIEEAQPKRFSTWWPQVKGKKA